MIEGETQGVYSMAMWEDSAHNLWIGTWEKGLWKLNPNTHQVEKYLVPGDKKGGLHIHSIIEYTPEIFFIGSDDGLTIFNPITHESYLYDQYGEEEKSLSDKFIYPMLKDREGGVWIGTYYNGVNYLPPYCGQFHGYSGSDNTHYFRSQIISRFCEDEDGNIWIGSDDFGISCFIPSTRQFINFPGIEKLQKNNVHALCYINKELWIGTYSNGIQILNTQTGQIRNYNVSDGLDESSIYSIFKDSQGRIWTGSMSGLCLYDSQQHHFSFIKDLNALIIEITEDAKGNLWIATQGKGVFKYSPQNQVWEKYAQPQGLNCTNINHLCINRENELWAATSEGLYLYNSQKKKFIHQPLKIPNECINAILEGEDCLWLTTAKGLVKYTPATGATQIFTKSDGLQSEAFIMASALKTRNGEFYIGSINGFNTFYPHLLKLNTQKPNVVLTGLEIFNKKIETQQGGILPEAIDHLKEIHLPYKDNVITLTYAALSYCTPEKNQYAYILEGFDKGWNYVGSQHSTTYTNLPPGTYTFRVKASNNDNVWNEEGTSIRIIIHPPFYFSLPFKIGYFLLFILAIGLLLRYVVRKSEKKHAKAIDELNNKKEKEIHEAKINFFTMIAHEIRTPVSLIIGPLEKVMQSTHIPADERQELEIIDRNSQRLLYLVNQLLDFRKVEQKEMRMHFTSQSIRELMEGVCERFSPTLHQKGVSFSVVYPDKNFYADVDKEAITKVLSNLLTNANKYTNSMIEVRFQEQPKTQTFSIQVKDNGKGMSEEELGKIFKPFYQASENKPGTGIGLSIVKGIVEAHYGKVEVTSQPGIGSTFIITLPQKQERQTTQEGENLSAAPLPEDIIPEQHDTTVSAKVLPIMLIVDDNEDMLHFLSSHFQNNYTIVTASDGSEALHKLKEQEVSLIISDWMMPRMSGIELCKAVRSNQLTSHIPFILLTAKTGTEAKIASMNCGADAYIEKPFSLQYLEACIKNLLELRLQLRQKFSQMPTVSINSIAANQTDKVFLEKMNHLIEENLNNDQLSVDFLAEKLCISRSGLFVKLKGLANTTPNEMIQIIRLKKAASLLLENQYRINEVSYMVGFNNPSYFSKCFQKQFGMKPGEYIASHTPKQTHDSTEKE
ncbi:hybrid sensor histidine kinase/response regulator transcription factor [Phocaeicola fibrisolvens]|uniref:hybrid sensor histidine kinase/response regulator transcription factor n=1 Tax=Phocaeicola fibrisolvens TaxID=2981793 RepID=UPI00082168A1|nr:hybrid sensor histidine kinase/response regulator transcription factor [Phocaeicola fibrisolvens]MCU6778998.1 ATP-binding protein [Phocaeicola fibrisolvens]SCI16430.1 Sensor protein evgS precursor [uncultured Bacteroides sp.]